MTAIEGFTLFFYSLASLIEFLFLSSFPELVSHPDGSFVKIMKTIACHFLASKERGELDSNLFFYKDCLSFMGEKLPSYKQCDKIVLTSDNCSAQFGCQ